MSGSLPGVVGEPHTGLDLDPLDPPQLGRDKGKVSTTAISSDKDFGDFQSKNIDKFGVFF